MARRVSSPELVGRSEPLAALMHALDDAPRVVLLAGDAGMGKTRLASEFAARAAAAGARVLWGECVPMQAGELPYAPFATALRGIVEPAPAADRDPAEARAERFEAVVSALERTARDAPVVLVIEDLHWADGATQDLLRFLISNLGAMRLLVLVSVRTDEPGVSPPLQRLIGELTRAAERLDLEPLERDETKRQLTAILGAEPADATVAAIQERAEGNPYFAEELLAAGELSAPLRSVLLARVADLDPPARRVLELVATAGGSIEHERLVRAAGDAPLRELVDRHALVHKHSRYAFRHALAGEAVYAELLPAERRALNATLARAIEAGPPDPAALAHHLAEAGEDEPALRASLAAADAAAAVFAFGAVRHQLQRARELSRRVETVEFDEIELLRRLAEATRLAGDWEDALPIAEEALRLACGDPREAALHTMVANLHHTSAPALPHLERALELLGDEPTAERAAVLLSIVSHRFYGQVPSLDIPPVQEALAVARAAGALAQAGTAHCHLGSALAYAGDPDTGLAHLREACRIASELGSGAELGRAVGLLGDALTMLGHVEEGLEAFAAGLEELERLGVARSYGFSVESDIADCELRLGRWDAARERLERLQRRVSGDDHVRLVVLGYQLSLDAREGHFEAAAAREPRVVALLDANVGPHCVVKANSARAEFALLRGDPEAAREIVADTRRRSPTADLLCGPALMTLGLWAEADLGDDPALADELLGGLDRPGSLHWYAFETPRDEIAPPETVGNWALGNAERARLDGVAEPDLWWEAAQRFEQVSSPYQAAYARFREAEARLAAHDRAGAAAPLRAAHAVTVALGAAPLRARVDTLARRASLPLATDAPRPFDLTARELTVLQLLAVGRTNRAIAGDLYLSPRTVDMHVRNILGKLDAANRVEAAAAAHRAGLITAELP